MDNLNPVPLPLPQDTPYRVLYIDDEAILLEITVRYLENIVGLTVDTAESAVKGLEMLKGQDYDAIISDYEMPGKNGIELLKELRDAGNEIPFIIFTGKGREEVAIAALNAGADFYLQKGGKPQAQFAELINAVTQAVQRRRAEEKLRHSESEKKQILEALGETMIFVLPDYTVAWANHAFCETLGKNQEEIVGRPCYEIVWGRNEPCDLCLVPQVRKTGKPATKEATFPDGRTFEVGTHPVYDDAGTITGYIERGRDISEVKKARQEIQEQKKELELIVDATTNGLWKWNFITGELWFSPRYYAMLGYEPDAFPADYEHWVDLLHPDDRESALSVAKESLEHKHDRYENEFRLRTADGNYRWMRAVARVVEQTPDGTVVRIIGNHEDITDLRENELKCRMVFNTARDMIYLHEICDDDSPGRILDANEEACREMGYSLEEMKTLQVTDLSDPDYETDLSEIISAARKQGEFLREWRHVTKTGQIIPVEISFRAFQMDGKRVGVAVVRNISDWKEAEKTLQEEEEKYRRLFEESNDAIFLHQSDGNILDTNAAAADLLGYTRDEFREMNVADLSPEEALNVSELALTITQKDHGIRFETEFKRRDGSQIPVEISSRVTDPDLMLIQGIVRDMTEHQQTEAALMLANKKVSLLNSITRHDIINLITAQMLYLDLLRQTSDSRKQAEYLDTLETTTERIEHDIIFTRDYQNLGAEAPVWQNPETIINAEWSTHHGTEPVRLEVSTGNLEIFADRMLSKVIGNLMDNAFKHAGTITCLTFRTEEQGSERALICEDDGVGISPEKKELLFQPVFNKKHGYGLYLISEILAITGMTITEEGTPSKGARFVILIPEGVWREKQDQKAADNQ